MRDLQRKLLKPGPVFGMHSGQVVVVTETSASSRACLMGP